MSKGKPNFKEIHWIDIPEDKENPQYLKGEHPVVVTSHNNDNTSNVVGCSSKNRIDDIELLTKPPMDEKTWARVSQGERALEDNLFNKESRDELNRYNTNFKEIKDSLH